MKITNEEDDLPTPFPLNQEELEIFLKYASRFCLELPPQVTQKEVSCVDHILYCPYHRRIGHSLDDCNDFKCLVIRQIKMGR